MKKAVILFAEGFEEIEALSVVDILRRAGIVCDMCSIGGKVVSGAHKIKIEADLLFDETNFDEYDALILPGGMPGSAYLRDDKRVIEVVKKYNNEDKIIGAICAAPLVLERAEIIEGRKITSYPSEKETLKASKYVDDLVAVDNNLITSRGPATAFYFAYEILNKLGAKDEAANLKEGMLLNFVESKIKG